jgi:hypothetical protein
MPTVSFIRDKDIERYGEAMDYRRPAVVPAPTVWLCHECGRPFEELAILNEHRKLEHPVLLPVIYVRGRPLLRENVLRMPLKPKDIVVERCDFPQLRVDGGPWQTLSPVQLARRLAAGRDAVLDIRLGEVDYRVSLRRPNLTVLNRVDRQFLRLLAVDGISHTLISEFEATLPLSSAEREYAAALGDYALGVLLKEGRGSPSGMVEFAEYAVKFKTALEVLRQFDRPVAAAVSSVIRFNLNDFFEYGLPAAKEVRLVNAFFRSLIEPSPTPPATSAARTSRSVPICPVDDATHRILTAAWVLADRSSSPAIVAAALDELELATILSDHDLVKSYAVRAVACLRDGRHSDAEPFLRRIQYDAFFEPFARDYLRSEEL